MIDPNRIPTALSTREVDALSKMAKGMRVAEAGALLGYSTLQLAKVASLVVSIDRHEGYGPSTLRSFMSNVEGVSNVVPIVGDAKDILPLLEVDRYFIDLDGTYETTKAVLSRLPFRNQTIAVHDFGRVNCEGVARAILELDGFIVDSVVDTLAIIRRR
jgi:predicted O-methyltransferase YrrM